MNNNITAIKTSTLNSADAIDAIDGLARASVANTDRLQIDIDAIGTIITALDTQLDTIATDVSFLENTDLTDL
jgi:hypothetical protein